MMLVGVMLTLSSALLVVFTGIVPVTTGFFVAHAVASSSVGPLAGTTKGHAASLYLLFYYLGSSILGSVDGWFWQHGGWNAVVLLTSGLAVIGMLVAHLAGHHK